MGRPVVILARWGSQEWFWHGGEARSGFGTVGKSEKDYYWAQRRADRLSPAFGVQIMETLHLAGSAVEVGRTCSVWLLSAGEH
jgi:hypothetical protein